ncbi:MAG: redoxin domain-containing protein [Candidatus Methylarchaceae archaeon HK01B]|nr:redoxin domain-containing protein [Candidatus Methylarchaceae archaeon HK01B]
MDFRDMIEEFEKEGIVVLGVSKDRIQSHQKFKKKHKLPFLCSATLKENSWTYAVSGRREISTVGYSWVRPELPSSSMKGECEKDISEDKSKRTCSSHLLDPTDGKAGRQIIQRETVN